MAKTKRNKKQQKSNRYSLLDCEIRPVTEADKWCKIKKPKGQVPVGDAPFGYIVTVPYCPNKNTFLDNVDGYIVRSKKHCGNLLLQVIKKDFTPDYGIKSAARIEPDTRKGKRKNKKKLYRIMSIKNLSKSADKWGKKIN